MTSKTPETFEDQTARILLGARALDRRNIGAVIARMTVPGYTVEDHTGHGTALNAILAAHTAALEAAKREARIDELQGVQEHHDAIPVPWEVGTGPYIAGRLTQLSTHLPWEQTDDNKYDGLPRVQIMQMKTDLSLPNQPKQEGGGDV